MPYQRRSQSVAPYRRPAARRPAYRKPAYRRPAPKRRTRPMSRVAKGLGYGLAPIGGLIGGALGGPGGAALGSTLGGIGGSMLAHGFGDYTISKNSILKGTVPQVQNSGKPGSGTIITFKEYMGDVISDPVANTFHVDAFQIQPTNPNTFPWLSQVSANYQEWACHGLIFEFKSSSGDALDSTNTALGSLIMATNYNASLDNFASRSEMENTEYSNSIKPSQSCMHAIESARSASVISNLYTSDADGHSDIRLSSLGNFQIASMGVQGTSVNLGSVYCSYQIELLKPKLFDSLGEDVSVLWAFQDGCVDALPLGTAFFRRDFSNMNTIVPTGTELAFPYNSVTKQYCVSFRWNGGSVASMGLPSFVPSRGATIIVDMFKGNAGSLFDDGPSQESVTGTILMYTAFYEVLGGSHEAVLTLGTGGTLPVGDCRLDMKMTEIPNSVDGTGGSNSGWLDSQ